jgi:hypothetical protein
MLDARAARMQALPAVLQPASATALPAGALRHAAHVRAALAAAKHDPSDPRWDRVHDLAWLACTRSRTRPVLPPRRLASGST